MDLNSRIIPCSDNYWRLMGIWIDTIHLEREREKLQKNCRFFFPPGHIVISYNLYHHGLITRFPIFWWVLKFFFPKNGWNLWEHMRTHQQCYLCCFRFQLDDLNLMKSHWPCSLVNSYRMYFSSQPWTKPEVYRATKDVTTGSHDPIHPKHWIVRSLFIMIRWITDPQLNGKNSNESVPEISEDDFIISEADFGQTCN